MVRKRPDRGWRGMARAVALFAITLNFLQPLAHAALLRDGPPSTVWTVFCKSTAADPEGKSGSGPVPGQQHDCCLGLAHTVAFVEPPSAFVLIESIAVVSAPSLPVEQPTPVGIRDGPSQPRGPPLLV